MSSNPRTAQFIEDQLAELDVRTGKMFGEFAVYVNDKVVGFICDDTLFLKQVIDDPSLAERSEPGHPYPGSKIYRAVNGDALEDREWLSDVVQQVADALPTPPPKNPRRAR